MAQGGIKNAQGEIFQGTVPQPTLPDVSLDDDDYGRSKRKVEVGKWDENEIYSGARESLLSVPVVADASSSSRKS